MPVGTRYPAEWQSLTDELTGRPVIQLTNSAAEDYHLYYYNPSITPDGKYLIFFSERTGLSNMFRLDLVTGEIAQLSDTEPARAEYWPFSFNSRGAGACLSCIGSGGREVFYFEGTELFATNIYDFTVRHVYSLPSHRRPSIINADAAGETLVFATWDEAHFASGLALMGQASDPLPPDDFFYETDTIIMRVAAATGAAEAVARLEKFWSNHVLINPHNRDWLLMTHEFFDATPQRKRTDRMWLANAASGQVGAIPGQPSEEWFMHEFWSRDGQRVYFHGGRVAEQAAHGFCGWCKPHGTDYTKFDHFTPERGYGHYNLHPDGVTMITDGERYPGCLSKVHLQNGQQIFEVICRHDSYRFVDDQRCHPHPSFSPDGQQVVFTSNRAGTSNIYLTSWDARK
jgi:oligogalacturonide lyase